MTDFYVQNKETLQVAKVYQIIAPADWDSLESIPTVFLIYYNDAWEWVDTADYGPYNLG